MAEIDWFPEIKNKVRTVRDALAGIERLNGPLPTPGTKIAECCENMRPGQTASDFYKANWGFNLFRLNWNKPSPTFTKGGGACGLIHPELPRKCIKEEYQAIMSFPREVVFAGNQENARERIGNSVPPLFMFAIANRIRQLFLDGQNKTFMSNKYLDLLDEAWQAHLAPREPSAPTFISLFAGCGGSSLGYSMAGYRELLAVEWDDNAVATFKLNFPDVPVYHGDIHKLTVEQCLEMTGLQPGELDLLDGSPPCQGFSTAGKRQMDDLRNQLYHEYVRLLRGLQPKVFVMENVSGLVKGKMKLIFADIMRELKASGYQVRCKLLNAMYFNVPQSRERLIWIGVRNDLEVRLNFPKASNGLITASQAVVECPEYQRPPEWRAFNFNLWQRQKPGQNGLKGRYFNHCRLHPSRPSPTVPKSCVFGGFSGLCHWKEPRSLNLGELRRLCSFSDGFNLIGTFEDGLNRIGNSVPPLFMRAIAQHIKDAMLVSS